MSEIKNIESKEVSRGHRAELLMFDDFYLEDLDAIIDKLNAIGNINPIPHKELEIYLSSAEEEDNAE